jgi:hypothetical protein
MSEIIFYIKKGRRYVPHSTYSSEFCDSFPKGTHIVMSYPGGRSTRYNIEPAYAPMIAAGRVAEDAISKSIMDASALRVPKRDEPLTPAQLKAWKALAKEFGSERYALEWCSYREAAEAGVKAMQAEADKLMTNPSVRKAYEHFLLLCELTKDHNEQSKT